MQVSVFQHINFKKHCVQPKAKLSSYDFPEFFSKPNSLIFRLIVRYPRIFIPTFQIRILFETKIYLLLIYSIFYNRHAINKLLRQHAPASMHRMLMESVQRVYNWRYAVYGRRTPHKSTASSEPLVIYFTESITSRSRQ